MASNYPDDYDVLTNPSAGSSVVALSHASEHTNANDILEAIEVTLGTTAGTNVLKDFAAGEFPVRVNSGGTIKSTVTLGTINNAVMGTPAITGGVHNSASFSNPIFTGVVNSGGTVRVDFGAAITPAVGTLADPNNGGTVSPNLLAGQLFSLVIGTAGIRTIGNPTSATIDGQMFMCRVQQNAGVTGTIGWGTGYKWNLGSAGTLGTVASAWNYYGFRTNMIGTTYDNCGVLVDVG